MKMAFNNNILVVIFAFALSVMPYASLAQQGSDADVIGLGGITPVGNWQAEDGDSRYLVTLCGDGTQLCAKLVWINPDKINERNQQYIDKYVVYQAWRAKPAEWRGDINIYGTIVGGSVKQLGMDVVKVTGCAFWIFCESFLLERISGGEKV